MYVQAFPGLDPLDLVRPMRPAGFPFDADRVQYFYRARHAIFHLFAVLRSGRRSLTVLAPDFHSGNEILAIQAAGATVRYLPVDDDLRLDPEEVARACDAHHPDVLYVIHYFGWAQPIAKLAEICRQRNILLVEDCALALLSAPDGRPLGSYGDYSVFCLYKTLPVPNGAVLVQNARTAPLPESSAARRVETIPAALRLGQLVTNRLRTRSESLASAIKAVRRLSSPIVSRLLRHRQTVGDIGFTVDDIVLQMSAATRRLIDRLDFQAIRQRRRDHFRQLLAASGNCVTSIYRTAPDGLCPLFFPILVVDKRAAAKALRDEGIDAIEFWNDTVDEHARSPRASFMRAHLLALPLQQDLSLAHIDYMAGCLRKNRLGIAHAPANVHAA